MSGRSEDTKQLYNVENWIFKIHSRYPRPRGGALGQVSYGGVQLWGPNPYPILGKAGLRKHTLF